MRDNGGLFFWQAMACFAALFLLTWVLVGCASDDIAFDDPVACGDSLCLETVGRTVDEVYVGDACEEGNGVGVDLSACCPEGYEAVGYCDTTEHVVACVRECDDV